MKPKLILCLALVLSAGLLIAQNTNSSAIKIIFTKPFIAPSQDALPKEALYPKNFDAKEQGAFTNFVTGQIAALNIMWTDADYFKTENQAQSFLCNLLSSSTQTYNYHVWSFGDPKPILIVTVEYKKGKQGKLFVWPYPKFYWAYLDENGKWWWSMNKDLKLQQ